MAYLSCAKDNEYPLLLIFDLAPRHCSRIKDCIVLLIFTYQFL